MATGAGYPQLQPLASVTPGRSFCAPAPTQLMPQWQNQPAPWVRQIQAVCVFQCPITTVGQWFAKPTASGRPLWRAVPKAQQGGSPWGRAKACSSPWRHLLGIDRDQVCLSTPWRVSANRPPAIPAVAAPRPSGRSQPACQPLDNRQSSAWRVWGARSFARRPWRVSPAPHRRSGCLQLLSLQCRWLWYALGGGDSQGHWHRSS